MKKQTVPVKAHLFRDDVFSADVVVIAGCPLEQAMAIAKKYDITITKPDIENHRQSTAITFQIEETDEKKKPYQGNVVWLQSRYAFYDLVHEAVHLVRNIFVQRGIAFVEQNDEAIAYYVGYWVKRIWHEIGLEKRRQP